MNPQRARAVSWLPLLKAVATHYHTSAKTLLCTLLINPPASGKLAPTV